MLPYRRLSYSKADVHDEQRWQNAYHKHRTPSKVWEEVKDEEVCNCGEQVAAGVALLENAGEESSCLRWQ